MVRNFAEFARYPWATQCLEMARRTGGQHSNYERDAFGDYIRWRKFHDALQDTRSVGFWYNSVQGELYWIDICNSEFGYC
jgi:hypothetical protein